MPVLGDFDSRVNFRRECVISEAGLEVAVLDLSKQFIPVRQRGAESSCVGGELVVLDGRGRTLRGFNATAARVWDLMDGRRSAVEISRVLADEFHQNEEQVLADVLSFVQSLVTRGLVEERGS